MRFYAGVPLKTREGSAIGTLCVMDTVPRALTEAQRDALDKLAKAVSSQLNLRRQLRIATQTDRLTGLPNWFHFEAQFDASRPQQGIVCLRAPQDREPDQFGARFPRRGRPDQADRRPPAQLH